jgi:hypothetical protein
MLIKHEITGWYDTLERINKLGTDTGAKIATIAAAKAPGMVQGRMQARRAEFEALGMTPEEAAEAIVDPSKLQGFRRRAAEMRASPGGPGVFTKQLSAAQRGWQGYAPTGTEATARGESEEVATRERDLAGRMRRGGFLAPDERMGRARAAWLGFLDIFTNESARRQFQTNKNAPDGSASNPFHSREAGPADSGSRT